MADGPIASPGSKEARHDDCQKYSDNDNRYWQQRHQQGFQLEVVAHDAQVYGEPILKRDISAALDAR